MDVLDRPYVRKARAKGLWERVILFRHVMPNANVPILTQISLHLGYISSAACASCTHR
jgi:ABC-type dipeptide/oligopeptide/nickel transport system permease component